MMKYCFGPDGKPDFEKMSVFMESHDRAGKLDTVGWGLLFIWIGIAWIAAFSFGIGLLGVAAITLGVQLTRKLMGFSIDFFWVVVGIFFALGAVWELINMEISLMPVLLIIVGLLLIGSLNWRK